MRYRDLVPDRQGGSFIASHIQIPGGGPVPDYVHFHKVRFQMIYCYKGWVRVVYEDQGPPFVMAAGDMVLQPPGIRHRVLESAPGLEVVEITCPALHETFADHEMDLPNGNPEPARQFCGQHFRHHVAAEARWTAWHGGEARVSGMRDASGARVDACTVRPGAGPVIAVPPHDGELVFGFVLEGSVRLDHRDGHRLGPADAFVIPPGEGWRMTDGSDDFRLLHVTTGRLGHEPIQFDRILL
jgi:quercetin dioxygenase-like cupin family protein